MKHTVNEGLKQWMKMKEWMRGCQLSHWIVQRAGIRISLVFLVPRCALGLCLRDDSDCSWPSASIHNWTIESRSDGRHACTSVKSEFHWWCTVVFEIIDKEITTIIVSFWVVSPVIVTRGQCAVHKWAFLSLFLSLSIYIYIYIYIYSITTVLLLFALVYE